MGAKQTIRALGGRTLRQWKFDAADLAIRTGLRPYQSLVLSSRAWDAWFKTDDEYRKERLSDITEISKQSLLAGYLQYLGNDVSILDLGCGHGLLRQQIEGRSFRRYVGVDPTAKAIEIARKPWSDDRTAFVLGDPMHVSLEPADVVVCCEVLYHVPDCAAFVSRAAELTRPGGYLLSSVWRHPGDSVLWREVNRHFELVDQVVVRDPVNRAAPKGWRVACHRKQ